MLAPVTGLTQVAQDATGTTFGWAFVTDADGYDISLDGAAAGSVAGTGAEISPPPGAHTIGVAPFADPTPPTQLAFAVPSPAQTPATPTGLAVTAITSSTVTVRCDPVADATDYGLYLDGTLLAAQPSPVWNLTGLDPQTTHSVAVDASNAAGPSAPSASVSFTTLPPGSPPPSPPGSVVLPVAVGAGALLLAILLATRQRTPRR